MSGLILLFERLLQVGDVIDVSGVSGTLRRIGIRSSTIETFDGAEVIGARSDLVAAVDHGLRAAGIAVPVPPQAIRV